MNGGPPWVPSSITDSTPDHPAEQRQHRPVDQPGDGAGVLLVGQQTDPRPQVAPLDHGGDAFQMPWRPPQQQGQTGQLPADQLLDRAGGKAGLAHSAASRSAASITR